MSYIEIDPTGLGNYELALARIPELEVDLASAVTSLKRVQEDNGALRDIHADLVSAYKRLQEQSENVKVQLQREQDEKKGFLWSSRRRLQCGGYGWKKKQKR